MIMLLRTLTGLSKIGFGRYRNATVNEVMLRKRHTELISMYYKLGNINFSDEVLLQLGIYEKDRIPKPGKIPEAYPEAVKRFWEFYNMGKDKIQVFKEISHRRKERKEEQKNLEVKRNLTRGQLQAINHGRFN